MVGAIGKPSTIPSPPGNRGGYGLRYLRGLARSGGGGPPGRTPPQFPNGTASRDLHPTLASGLDMTRSQATRCRDAETEHGLGRDRSATVCAPSGARLKRSDGAFGRWRAPAPAAVDLLERRVRNRRRERFPASRKTAPPRRGGRGVRRDGGEGRHAEQVGIYGPACRRAPASAPATIIAAPASVHRDGISENSSRPMAAA